MLLTLSIANALPEETTTSELSEEVTTPEATTEKTEESTKKVEGVPALGILPPFTYVAPLRFVPSVPHAYAYHIQAPRYYYV